MTITELLAHIEIANQALNKARHGVPDGHPLKVEFRQALDAIDMIWERTNEANFVYEAQIPS